MKFRKLPVEIEAVQWKGDNFAEILLLQGIYKESKLYTRENYSLIIPTLEGEMTASNGDWIIRGASNELYPCKPDIFALTYEAV